jgi:hypothetical protein
MAKLIRHPRACEATTFKPYSKPLEIQDENPLNSVAR